MFGITDRKKIFDEISTEIEEIDPETAKKYLKKNFNNRNFNKKSVEYFAKKMVAGEWDLTHQGIAFGKNGNLLDGQNRLAAIIKCGKPVLMFVTRGLKFEYPLNVNIDRGIQRNNAVILGENKKVVMVANFLTKLALGQEALRDPQTVGKVLDSFKPFIIKLFEVCSSNIRGRSAVPVRAAAIVRSIENEDVIHQYRKFVLVEPEGMWKSVIGLLRQTEKDSPFVRLNQFDIGARAWIAFDFKRKNLTKIQIKNRVNVIDDFRETVRELI